MGYFRVSSGQDLPGQTRIREKSQIRIMQEEARLQEEAEERQYERALEEQERQSEFVREERKRQRIIAEQAKQAKQKSYLRELEDTSIATKTGTLSDTGGYRPTTGRIQSEQVYGSMPTAQKIEYLTGRVRTAVQDEPSRRLREEIEAYGGVAPPDMSTAGLTRLRDIQKGEDKELEKERIEDLKSQEKGKKIVEWYGSMVRDPKVSNTFTDATTGIKYGLNTITEARRKFVEKMKRQPSPAEEEMLAQIPWPPDGVDEVAEAMASKYKRQVSKPIKTVIKGNDVFTQDPQTGELTKIQTIDTKNPQYLNRIKQAFVSIDKHGNSERAKKTAYRLLVEEYPEKTSEIIRILWPQKANQLLDIIQSLVEE